MSTMTGAYDDDAVAARIAEETFGTSGGEQFATDLIAARAESNGRTMEPASTEHDYRFVPYGDFAARSYPVAAPLLGKPGSVYLAESSLLIVYGSEGASKSTWTIDGVAHLAAGVDWLGLPVPRPVRLLLIENEGPAGLYQQKLAAKHRGWQGPDFRPNVHLFAEPWNGFTFADQHAREILTAYCEEHAIDLVMANPTLGLGVAASGRPDETQLFVDWLRECGLGAGRAFWLIHHENKAGQISGDWGRHGDTNVLLQADGNHQRTKLTWQKTRWATLEPGERALMLNWDLPTQGYTVAALDTVGASDELLVQRLATYLDEHPATATKHVLQAVEGGDSRLTELLNQRPEFDYGKGSHGAKLWMLAARSAEAAA